MNMNSQNVVVVVAAAAAADCGEFFFTIEFCDGTSETSLGKVGTKKREFCVIAKIKKNGKKVFVNVCIA